MGLHHQNPITNYPFKLDCTSFVWRSDLINFLVKEDIWAAGLITGAEVDRVKAMPEAREAGPGCASSATL